MRNIVILNSLHFSYPLPILMRVSYNTLIVKQNTSDYYKYTNNTSKTDTMFIFGHCCLEHVADNQLYIFLA